MCPFMLLLEPGLPQANLTGRCSWKVLGDEDDSVGLTELDLGGSLVLFLLSGGFRMCHFIPLFELGLSQVNLTRRCVGRVLGDEDDFVGSWLTGTRRGILLCDVHRTFEYNSSYTWRPEPVSQGSPLPSRFPPFDLL